jgi:SPP1 gp7 family putative phage head morphogenesis protein
MSDVSPFGLAPEDALRWFRQKGLKPSFDWRDVWAEQHAKAFTVAKATQLDVLADLYQGVSDALAKGQTVAQFRKQLKPLLQSKGWWGEKEMADPKTGELRTVQLGSARRLQIIYDTNLRTAHAAAQWQRVERVAKARPWLRYVAIDGDGRTRALHLKWNGTTLRWDDPWWKTHYPPNGWGCRCKVIQLSDRDLERYGFTPSSAAPKTTYSLWHDERNGITRKVPNGIDPGFDVNVGQARGVWSPEKEPATDDVRTFRDYGRPPARSVTTRAPAEEKWDTPHTDAVRAAMGERWNTLFGAEEAPVKDPTGDQALFTKRYLDYLLKKGDTNTDIRRVTFVPQARAAVENPYEIWLVPHRRKDGSVTLRKRYIQLVDNGSADGYIVVVDRSDDGYVAWTSYPKNNIDKQRAGYLLWSR